VISINANVNGEIRDALSRLYQCVLFFKSVIPFRGKLCRWRQFHSGS